ncbi:MAG: mechanosensitive ion channel [Marinifilaceae bacterium]|nr:mechanosensitive ion channel [Marinifilaceae bacterium]
MRKLVEEILSILNIDSSSESWIKDGIFFAVILFVSMLCGILVRRLIFPMIKKVISRTSVKWDDVLFSDKMLKTIGQLVPAIVAYFFISLFFEQDDTTFHELIWRVMNVYLIAIIIKFVCVLIESIDTISSNYSSLKDRPLHGVYQMLKLIAICLGIIVIIANVIGKSPLTLITGIGAAATVLMLVFKDSIVGFVAGIQLSVNDMLRPGDWICVPKAGADGEVIEVSMTTVKVQNWDKTITTIPPYALVSDAFQNWRGMRESGGRRMKRSVNINFHSIRCCTDDEIASLLDNGLITAEDLDSENVNVVLYTRSMERYMNKNNLVHQGMTKMVRQLEPGSEGLPVEFYCFCADTDWVVYEHFQTSFMGHALTIMPEFGLCVFQRSCSVHCSNSHIP